MLPSVLVHSSSKANVRDSVSPYFSLFYSRTSAGTGGLCKAKRVEGERRGEERGLWPMGWTVLYSSSPLGNGFILFYFIILCWLCRTDGSCTVRYYYVFSLQVSLLVWDGFHVFVRYPLYFAP